VGENFTVLGQWLPDEYTFQTDISTSQPGVPCSVGVTYLLYFSAQILDDFLNYYYLSV